MIPHENSNTETPGFDRAQGIVTRRADGEPVTTSMAIAEGMNVQHKNVLELVRRYPADLEEFGGVTFEIQPFDTPGGIQSREIALLNEQQATVLISYMRNSEMARTFKKALVKGFYEMRAALRAAPDPLASLPPEQRALIAVMVDNAAIKQRQDKLDATQVVQAEQIQRIAAKQSAFEDGYSFFTALGFCAMRGVKLVMTGLQRLGRSAAAYSKQMNIPVERVRDPRFGMVNSYHESALDAAFVELHKGL